MSIATRSAGDGQGPSSATRLAAVLLLALALLVVGALGWAWQQNREIAWAEPHWDADRFTRLHGTSAEEVLHLVAVNPLCSQCLLSLDRALERRNAQVGRYRIGVLIVDTPRQPTAELFARRGADETWWDRDGVWRERWGHRVYGEIMIFESSGRYIGTEPPPRKVAR